MKIRRGVNDKVCAGRASLLLILSGPRRARELIFRMEPITSSWTGMYELWVTPSISLSLIIESESLEATWARSLSRLALWVLTHAPNSSLVRQTLEYEVQQRGTVNDVISATTLRVVDSAYWRSLQDKVRDLSRPT